MQPRTGPIRADLLGNMWAQGWSNIYDVLAPAYDNSGDDLTQALQSKGYDVPKMLRAAEGFYTSLGFPPLPMIVHFANESFRARCRMRTPA